MQEERIFMTYDSPETEKAEKKQETVLTCKKCSSEHFRLVCTPGNFPVMHCADCEIEIGRVGWVPKNWNEVGKDAKQDLKND